ncbi:hypothetical protein [Methanobacterium sp. SMA-27]|uniref:hypothetical protein n=1 Tax=Methanobacterium sp. SMA-27 TaxID=1495336 RepID=UPI00064EB021|nr:hypothetical protein [Methanobacterium sp. SMA-27]
MSPGKIDIKMQSPQVFTGEISVSNIGDSPLNVKVNKKRMMKNATTTLYADDGIATWINVDPAEFTLAPNEKKNIKYTITVPTNVNYYDAMGALQIVGTPTNSANNQTGSITTQVKQATAVVVPITLGFPGQIIESLSLISNNVPSVLISLMPSNLAYNVKNNGTVQAKMTNNVTVTGLFENQKIQTNGTVFPGDSYTLKTQWTPGFFDMGLYNVESNIKYGRDQQTQNLQTKNTILVSPVWIIILILLIVTIWIIRKKDIKSPLRIKIEKK